MLAVPHSLVTEVLTQSEIDQKNAALTTQVRGRVQFYDQPLSNLSVRLLVKPKEDEKRTDGQGIGRASLQHRDHRGWQVLFGYGSIRRIHSRMPRSRPRNAGDSSTATLHRCKIWSRRSTGAMEQKAMMNEQAIRIAPSQFSAQSNLRIRSFRFGSILSRYLLFLR